MNIQTAKEEIIRTIRAYTAKTPWNTYAIPRLRQRPILLIGPPGIGKTAIMEQAAQACGAGFVSYSMTHHTRQSAIGLPFIEHQTFGGHDYAVTEYTMSEIIASVFQCIEETGCKEGLLFLDEINCVSETLAPAMLQFLQTKTFGSHRLPDGWVLAAAGNPPEYNNSVREFDIATLDRLKYIEIEADYDTWRSYALEHAIHGAVLSYLDIHRDRFYLLRQNYSSCSFVTARGWEDLSCILWQYETNEFPITAELILQYLHEKELAQDFAGYYKFFTACQHRLPITELMQGDPDAAEQCQKILETSTFDEALALVHLMLAFLNHRLQQWCFSAEHQKQLNTLIERLQRFQMQQHSSNSSEVLADFLKKEQEILAIRRTHALSSEQELQAMQQVLYEFRDLAYERSADPLHSTFTFIQEEHKQQHQMEAKEIVAMLERCILLLAQKDGAEFTLFLSGIFHNSQTAALLKAAPSSRCEQYRGKLDFVSRETALREKLSSIHR